MDERLTADQQARYDRSLLVPGIDEKTQLRLGHASVLIIGAGGLGGYVAQQLARAGVGHLGIVDFDQVSESNLQRQILYETPDVGRDKCHTATTRLEAINPLIRITPYPLRLSETNYQQVMDEPYDLVIDCCDNFACRYLTDRMAREYRMPMIYGSAQEWGGQVAILSPCEGMGYADLFPEPQQARPCVGVMPSVVGVVGSLQATEALKVLTAQGAPLRNRLILFDALAPSFRIINL